MRSRTLFLLAVLALAGGMAVGQVTNATVITKSGQNWKHPLARCAFVGDHANDLAATRLAGFAVAFNPKSAELEQAAPAVVRSRDLRAILPVLEG